MKQLISTNKNIIFLSILATFSLEASANCWQASGGTHSLSNASYSPGTGCSQYGVVVAGSPSLSSGDVSLSLDNITVTNTHPTLYGRGVFVASKTNNSILTTNVRDSSITLAMNNSSAGNAIGILSEGGAGTQNQMHYMSVADTAIDVSAQNSNARGIVIYTNSSLAKWSELQLTGNNIKVISTNANVMGISLEGEGVLINETASNNSATIEVSGKLKSTGIVMSSGTKQGTSYANILSSIDVTSTSNDAFGISATSLDANEVHKMQGSIKATADEGTAYGIRLNGAGLQLIDNQVVMHIQGKNAYGLDASSSAGKIDISNTQQINIAAEINGVGLKASNMGSDTTQLIHSGMINTAASTTATYTGIETDTTDGNTQILLNHGGITIGQTTNQAYGVSATSTGAGDINTTLLGSSHVLSNAGHFTAIKNTTNSGANQLYIDTASTLTGGLANGNAAIDMSSNTGVIEITNNGHVTALNDLAILTNNTAGLTTINNGGTIIGYSQSSGGDKVTFNNLTGGYYQMQHIIAGTKQTVTSDFGNNSIFNNSGTVAFSQTHANNNSATPNHSLFNVTTFNNQAGGVIDLTTKNPMGLNTLVGDTFTVSNDYISNGGALYLNTYIDPTLGISDKLIVTNDVTTGTSSTLIYITPTQNSPFGLLTGDGIEVVQVNGNSSSDAFALGRPVFGGIYQYGLFQGGTTSADSWYLRNIGSNPAVGSYLANQHAAINMFEQRLKDRLLAGQEATLDTAKANTLWLRTKIAHGSYNSVHDSFGNQDRTYMSQLGGDLGVWQINNGYLHLGLMIGYGDYKNTSTELNTRSKSEAKSKGYVAGIYGTWYQTEDADIGLYIDSWLQQSWYRNQTSNKGGLGTHTYNSTVSSGSLEIGYGYVFASDKDYQWIVTPQAQFTYNHYRMGSQYDKYNQLNIKKTKIDGLNTRLGARIQGRSIDVEKLALQPFIEINWLNTSMNNRTDFNGITIKEGVARDKIEAKIGLQKNLSKQLSISAQLGGVWGKRYREHQGQLNINYRW